MRADTAGIMKNAFALLACLLAATACSQDQTVYPSLGIRPAEKLGFAEPVAKPAVAAPDPALDTQIATMSKTLDGITTGFTRDAAESERVARTARGAAVGSETWLTAQTALAQLDDWRAQASSLVTDIERRATDRAAMLEPDYPALATLHARAQAETERQDGTIARIQAMVPGA